MLDWWFRQSVPFRACVNTFLVFYLFHIISLSSYFALAHTDCKHVQIPDFDTEVTTGQISEHVFDWLPWTILYHAIFALLPLIPWPALRMFHINKAGKNAIMMLIIAANNIYQIRNLSMTVHKSGEVSFWWGVFYLLDAYSSDIPPSYKNFMKVFDCKFRFHTFHNFLYTVIYFYCLGNLVHKAYHAFSYTVYWVEGRKFILCGFRQTTADGSSDSVPLSDMRRNASAPDGLGGVIDS
ncbi:hypothetical protein QR680_003890 [Steinernema hermaphroditum]|uniref:Uncharacterized protein n=1 Tax=Steinernema hermaphroditum TaxID=289476 RepID=A0AA39HND0_9BILA|nr:hypothetical protein QR680_003890 [Steinernema hermaphroditum]